MGFQQVYGNLTPDILNYGRRSNRVSVLGGIPSAWEATTEFNFGKDLLEDFVGCASLLWSKHWIERQQLPEVVQGMMPGLRRNLSGEDIPSDWGGPPVPVPIASGFTPPPPQDLLSLDPNGLKTGRLTMGNLFFDLADPSLLEGRYGVIATTGDGKGQRSAEASVGLPVGEDASSLIFLHACARPDSIAPGYTYIFNFPDTADLLGWYEVIYEDGFVATIPISYGVNIREWDWGRHRGRHAYVYWADAVTVGEQQDTPVTFFAYEWANPRLGKVVQEVRLHGSSGFIDTRGKVIPENAVVLRALSVVKKRGFPAPP
jgi:hypothetical protein